MKAAQSNADPAWTLEAALNQFQPIGLDSLDCVALLNRIDTKWAFNRLQLPAVLERITAAYRVLTIAEAKCHKYHTRYFDTPTLTFHTQHHNGVYTRHKVRYRKYIASGACFLEVKTKTNQGRTIKYRAARPDIATEIDEASGEFLHKALATVTSGLVPVLDVNFERLTFVNTSGRERLTLDLNLAFDRDGTTAHLPGLVIAELKRDRFAPGSPFAIIMRDLRVHEGSLSKYCFGVLHLCPSAKRNRFKQRFRELNALAAS